MAELREEVRTLRLEVDRLGDENRHLLEMVKGLEKDTYGNEDMRYEAGLEREESHVEPTEELDDKPEPSVEEYCDELGRERYMTEESCIGILIGIIAILKADTNGEAAGKVRKSGCLSRIGQLKNHRNPEISNRAQGILMRFSSYASGSGAGMPGGTSALSPLARKEQKATNPVSGWSGRGQHNPRKRKS